MEDTLGSKSKPGIVLLIAAVALFALRAFLHYAIAMKKSGNPSYALGYSASRAIAAPAVFAGLFCIPRKGRNSRRFAASFVGVSAIMLVLDLSQVGQNAH